MDSHDDTGIDVGRDGGDGVAEQLDAADTLLDRGVDPLDEGYSPPDREPGVRVPTAAEEARGLSLDELLSAEEPEVTDLPDAQYEEFEDEVGDLRAGRLVDADLGGSADTDGELWASDRGFAGAGASAEEAAVHVIDVDQ